MNIEFKRLVDTEYKAFANDQNALYCEYNTKRDRKVVLLALHMKLLMKRILFLRI